MSGMFGGASVNPYDDIVVKTTDENLTTENWELILNLCDKVNDEGPDGAHQVLLALLKRLAHRNPNVQLYTLTLAEALSKNCGIEVHRELASRAWTGGLEKVVVDRNTHDKVRRRILALIAMWTAEFESDSTLGVMEDCYNSLSAKGYRFETPSEPPPPAVDDEIRRKEEEELQRVLEMSMQDKGGRGAWSSWGSTTDYGEGSGSGSGSRTNGYASASASGSGSGSSSGYVGTSGSGSGSGGYTPSSTSTYSQHTTASTTSIPSTTSTVSTGSGSQGSTAAPSSPLNDPMSGIVTRVKALHSFQPTEPGELPFDKGDIIKVVDRGYRDWWRGQLRGRTGIFPVNYVEPLPEPTPVELAREAEAEAAVFAQAINVEKLLTLLRGFDSTKRSLADDEEIQELYRSSMALRPKIVKLIDKYSQKRADLVSMNETFLRARNIFDRMMEDSLARHTAVYSDPSYNRQSSYGPQVRPDSRVSVAYAQPQPYPAHAQGQGLPGYDQPPSHPGYTPVAAQFPQPGPYPGAGPGPAPGPGGYPQQQQQQQPQQPGVYGAQTPYGQPQAQAQPGPYGQQGPSPYPAVQQQQQPRQQTPLQQQVPPQQQPPPEQYQQQQQPQPQPTQTTQPAQTQPAQQQQHQHQGNPSGPPYVYDPKTTYSDPNVQAWAQYYAQGGKDPTGSVYFISVPGVKEQPPTAAGGVVAGGEGQTQGQEQGQMQEQGQVQGQNQNQNQVYQYPQQTQTLQAQGSSASLGQVPTSAVSPTGSVHSVHSMQGPGLGLGSGPAAASVESLGQSLPYPGDQQQQQPQPQSQLKRESSLPDPYANANANAQVNPGIGAGPASPTHSLHGAGTGVGAGLGGVVPGTPTSIHSLGHGPGGSPISAVPGGGAGGVGVGIPYNHPNTSQPSWLLPKMGSPPKSFASVPSSAPEGERASSPHSVHSLGPGAPAGGQGQGQGGAYGQASLYHGLQGQMSGLSLSDGQGQGQGGYQGVGATV